MPSRRSPDLLLELLKAKPVVDLATIRSALGHVSGMTAFRYLRRVPYRRSYNKNGRYYSLHDPSRYDRSGLWSWQDIHFSVDGSLRNTVRRLVHEAEAGASHRELQERLRVRAYNTLLDLLHKGEIDREQLAEVYIYLHTNAGVRTSQLQRRQELLARIAESQEAEASEEVIIQVLLTVIRHPGSGPGDVVRRLRGHSPPVTMQQVQTVFTRYELGGKGGPSQH
jgi:hypothetical protein